MDGKKGKGSGKYFVGMLTSAHVAVIEYFSGLASQLLPLGVYPEVVITGRATNTFCAVNDLSYSFDISTGLRLIASISAIMLAAISIRNAGW